MKIKARTIVPGKAIGEALVINDSLSFYGGVDPNTGKIIDRHSPAYGKIISGKILIFEGGRGSTVGSYVIYSLKKNGLAPKAMIVLESEAIIATGAALARIPLVDRPERNLLEIVEDGDRITLNAESNYAIIEIQKHGS